MAVAINLGFEPKLRLGEDKNREAITQVMCDPDEIKDAIERITRLEREPIRALEKKGEQRELENERISY